MLDATIKQQFTEYMKLLEQDVVITASLGEDASSKEMKDFLEEIIPLSPRLTLKAAALERTPSFMLSTAQGGSGIVFAGVPLGHEFSSFVLALLQVSGRPPKNDPQVLEKIRSITGEYHFETYVSLTCHNCPEVVQSLNLMSVLNPHITHTMIDGAMYQDEVQAKDIMNVPTVYLNGELFGGGRMEVEDILKKMGTSEDPSLLSNKEPFDVLVIGGGPAGASAAIYAARKGIRTGILADTFGGQVRDTQGIENFISVKETTGNALADHLEEHVKVYDVDIIKSQKAVSIAKGDPYLEVKLENGAVLKSKTLILATGARWRNVNIPGEAEYKTKGVAYCPHCDGPFYKGKDVAVIGGGNSGIEAAIDLAGIVRHVTVLEFMPQLKADAVLQKRLFSLPNVTVHTNTAAQEITGDGKVNGILYKDRETGEVSRTDLEGVFVQIGLVPNTEWLKDTLERNKMGEIVVDAKGATSLEGVFAAGDCTNSPYKQIIISMGSGATAALSAFDYLIRRT